MDDIPTWLHFNVALGTVKWSIVYTLSQKTWGEKAELSELVSAGDREPATKNGCEETISELNCVRIFLIFNF